MPEFTLKDMEVKKDMPGYSGGPAKVLTLTLEDQGGNTHQAEMFTMASTVLPTIGQKIEGEISDSDYGPKFSKGGAKKGGGGFKRSPGETKAIQRQHSQEQALRREANMIAAGGRPYNETQLRSVINFFEQDIGSKDRSISWDGFSDDVPGDDSDLPWSGPSEEELREKS